MRASLVLPLFIVNTCYMCYCLYMKKKINKVIAVLILAAFLVNCTAPSLHAQALMPVPGQMAGLSAPFNPPMLAGVKVYAKDPLRFDFILDRGDDPQAKEVSDRLIKYFLASLTVPEDDLWVNLSPYEKDRIIPDAFGQTGMGRDLLAQDYLLKQITASLMYPEEGLGKEFWSEVYRQAREKFGVTDIPVDTFNKVWITPAKAVVYEKGSEGSSAVAYVVDAPLQVMLETDYVAAVRHSEERSDEESPRSDVAKDIIRQIIIPALTKEVNEGKNFAPLRQVYHSLILASWYKKKIKDSLLSQVYVDQNKVSGVNIADPKETEKIWAQYVEAFRTGVFNFVKEERDAVSQEMIPRKYFSGGVKLSVDFASVSTIDAAVLPENTDIIQMRVQVAGTVDASEDLIKKAQEFNSQAAAGQMTMNDWVAWVNGIIDSRPGAFTEEEIQAVARAFDLDPLVLQKLKAASGQNALKARGFFKSLPDDGKKNVYLTRDALTLYLTERILGKKEPVAFYFSKMLFHKLIPHANLSDRWIYDMIKEALMRMQIPVTAFSIDTVRSGRFAEFKEAFYKVYVEIITGTGSGFQNDILSWQASRIKAAAGASWKYLHTMGIPDEMMARDGVRFIDSTMAGTFPLFLEATVRFHLEQKGFVNVAPKVGSAMFFSSLSAEFGFLNFENMRSSRDGDWQAEARETELSYYPVVFGNKMQDGLPLAKLDGSGAGPFLVELMLFKSALLALDQAQAAENAAEATIDRSEGMRVPSALFYQVSGKDPRGKINTVNYIFHSTRKKDQIRDILAKFHARESQAGPRGVITLVEHGGDDLDKLVYIQVADEIVGIAGYKEREFQGPRGGVYPKMPYLHEFKLIRNDALNSVQSLIHKNIENGQDALIMTMMGNLVAGIIRENDGPLVLQYHPLEGFDHYFANWTSTISWGMNDLSLEEQQRALHVNMYIQDAERLLKTVNHIFGKGGDPEMSPALKRLLSDMDQAETFDKGGIDLTAGRMDLETRGDGSLAMKFDLDPARLKELRAAPGFVPVIVDIQPTADLAGFLGVSPAQLH